MSFKRFTPSDFLVSTDSITAPCWTNNVYNLTTFYTSSTQANSSQGDYVLAAYQIDPTGSSAAIQFYIGYANALGSGSTPYDNGLPQYTPSSTIYGQWRNLILEDENASFVFGNVTQSQFYVVSVERANYKQSLFPGSLNLTLTSGSNTLHLTDNSNMVSTVPYINGTRVYQLVSGSNGTAFTTLQDNGYTSTSGSYGWLLADVGLIILSGEALDGTYANGGVDLQTVRTSNTASYNQELLFDSMNGGDLFTLNSKETLSSDYIFVRARNNEFNYSTNPSFISGSTGAILFNSFIDDPQVYITTVGLYNNNQELLAVAKLSRPLLKDFTKELLVRVRLDF